MQVYKFAEMLSEKHLGTKEALCKKGWGGNDLMGISSWSIYINSSSYLFLLLG